MVDYEMPASELHIRNAYAAWQSRKAEELGRPITMMMAWRSMPKTGKQSRIESLQPLLKAGKFHILTNAGPAEEIELLIQQFLEYLVSDHDDYPDVCARVIPWLGATTEEARSIEKPAEPVASMENGTFSIPIAGILTLVDDAETKRSSADSWGLERTDDDDPSHVFQSNDIDHYSRISDLLGGAE
jgi:hypothetical protein